MEGEGFGLHVLLSSKVQDMILVASNGVDIGRSGSERLANQSMLCGVALVPGESPLLLDIHSTDIDQI